MRMGLLLLAVMGGGILARAALLVWGPSEWLARPWEYEEIAQNLWRGQGFHGTYLGTTYHALVHPFYPWFCAEVYRLVGQPSVLAVQWAQTALVVAAAALAYGIAKELGSKRVGLLAAAGVVLHPGLLIYSLRPHPLWLDSLCFLAIVWLTLRAGRVGLGKGSWPWILSLGIALGWGMLSRSTVLAAVPFLGGWLWVRWKQQRGSLKRLAVMVGVAGVMAFPWLLRNWIVVGRPIGMLSSSAFSFWVGNHAGATGSALDEEGRPLLHRMPSEFIQTVYSLDEKGQVAFFSKEALSFLKRNPGRALRNNLAKWLQFWAGSSRTGAWYPSQWGRWYRIYYAFLLAFAGLGAFTLWSQGQKASLLLLTLFVLSISLLQSLVFVEGRHRWEVEPLLVVVASFGVSLLLRLGEIGVQGVRSPVE